MLFSVSVTKKEHQQKVDEIYEEEVRPLLKKDAQSSMEGTQDQMKLSSAQKAYLNCQSPI